MSQNIVDGVSLDQVLANTSDGVFLLDDHQRVVYFNPGCERLTGFRAEEILASGRPCSEITQCQDAQGRVLAGGLCPAREVFEGSRPSARQVMRITTKDGGLRWVETLYTRLRDPSDGPGYLIGVMRDVEDRMEREDEWRQTIGELRTEIERFRQQMREHYGFASIVTRSPAVRPALEKARAACANNSPVLVCGEAGTGKGVIARTIHQHGQQKDGPFVSFNVSATAKDRIEAELFGYQRGSVAGASEDHQGCYAAADDGTLFIEGVDRLPDSAQVKLLQALYSKSVRPLGATEPIPVQTRVIASTHRPVKDLFASGELREDLFHRLSVITIEMPPLRVRKEDIPLLVEQFIDQLNGQGTRQVEEIADEVWDVLQSHDWPGNTEELQNVLESAFAAGMDRVLHVEEIHFPASGGSAMAARELTHGDVAPVPLDDMMADFEREAILGALRRARGQRSLAARMLGISRSRLYRRMDVLGIVPKNELPSG